MYGPTTITTKGQVTIPEELRLLLKTQPGDKFLFSPTLNPQQFVVDVVSTKNVVEELGGSLKSRVKYTNRKDVEQKVGKFLAKELGLIK